MERVGGQPAPPLPLFGRAHELAQLVRLLDGLRDGRGAFAAVAGTAGIGKSRLLRELLDIASARGITVDVGYCSEEDSGVAYAPVLDALRRRRLAGTLSNDGAGLWSAMAAEGDRTGDTGEPDRLRVLDAVLAYAQSEARHTGYVLALEDLHWADRATQWLLRHIARYLDQIGMVLSTSFRGDESSGADAALRIVRDAETARLPVLLTELRPLTWAETRLQAQAVLGSASLPPTALIDAVYARTEGNPFFAEELLLGLPVRDGDARAQALLPDSLPASITDLIQRRIRALSRRARVVLGAAAVIGRRFDVEMLETVAALRDDERPAVLAELTESRLLDDAGDGRMLAFHHVLTQEAVASLLPSVERRRLHGAIAGVMEVRGRWNEDAAVIAHHYARAGEVARLRQFAELAADNAWSGGAPAEAARWYTQALSSADALGERDFGGLLRKCARARAAVRSPEAHTVYERLVAAHRDTGDMAALGEALAEYANLFFGDSERRFALLTEAEQVLTPLGRTPALARAHARLASFYVATSHGAEADDYGLRALDEGRATGATDAEAVAERSLGTVAAARGDFAAGYARLRRSIDVAARGQHHMDTYLSSIALVNAAIRAGHWEIAEEAARASIQHARRRGTESDAGSAMSRLAELLRITGRMQEARATVEQALLLLDEEDAYVYSTALLVKSSILADAGEWDAMRALVVPITPATARSDQIQVHGIALFLLLRAARAEGDIRSAIELAKGLRDLWSRTEDNYYLLPMVLVAGQVYCDAGMIDEARLCLTDLQMREPLNDHIGATVEALQATIACADERVQDAVTHWETSVAAYERSGRRVDVERARSALGRALFARGGPGDRAAAREQLVRARDALGACGCIEAQEIDAWLRRHRLVATRPDSRHGLTAREREIVVLIADGLTNRIIATRLTLSTRTVDNHVSRILGKLGLSSRGQLVAYAIKHGFVTEGPVK